MKPLIAVALLLIAPLPTHAAPEPQCVDRLCVGANVTPPKSWIPIADKDGATLYQLPAAVVEGVPVDVRAIIAKGKVDSFCLSTSTEHGDKFTKLLVKRYGLPTSKGAAPPLVAVWQGSRFKLGLFVDGRSGMLRALFVAVQRMPGVGEI